MTLKCGVTEKSTHSGVRESEGTHKIRKRGRFGKTGSRVEECRDKDLDYFIKLDSTPL